jgi:hypothetical protein
MAARVAVNAVIFNPISEYLRDKAREVPRTRRAILLPSTTRQIGGLARARMLPIRECGVWYSGRRASDIEHSA